MPDTRATAPARPVGAAHTPLKLVQLRPGTPRCCAGGPLGLLDLDGLRRAAAVGAAIRHELWSQLVHGTRPQRPGRSC
jgi:hypothetical protein